MRSGVITNSSPAGGVNTKGSGQVTPLTRSAPSIRGNARARATKSSGLTPGPVAITPRMTPEDRSSRVSARVSTPEIATTWLATR